MTAGSVPACVPDFPDDEGLRPVGEPEADDARELEHDAFADPPEALRPGAPGMTTRAYGPSGNPLPAKLAMSSATVTRKIRIDARLTRDAPPL